MRQAAAASLTEGLKKNGRLLTFVFNTLIQDKATSDRLRRFAHPMDERNLANEIDGATVSALMRASEGGAKLVPRYYRLKARLLGLDRLYDYDRYAPLPAAAGERSFSDARRIVLDAYRDFSPEMCGIAELFFERHWIDAELRPGKRGGAFSASTVPSVHPYVLLNYTGNLRDVMTVAHELGHGVHQYLARDRGLFEQDSPLPIHRSVLGVEPERRVELHQRLARLPLARECGAEVPVDDGDAGQSNLALQLISSLQGGSESLDRWVDGTRVEQCQAELRLDHRVFGVEHVRLPHDRQRLAWTMELAHYAALAKGPTGRVGLDATRRSEVFVGLGVALLFESNLAT